MRTSVLPLLLLAGMSCKGEPEPELEITGVEAAVADGMGTVVTVTWSTNVETTGSVEFGEDTTYGRVTAESSSGTEHSVTLAGLAPDTEIHFRVMADGQADTDDHSITTGSLENLPALTMEGTGDLYLALPVVTPELTWITLIDPQGRITWSWEDDRETEVYRARVSRDGTGMVYTATVFRGEPHEGSALVRVDWDGTERHLNVPYLAHDFIEMDDGTVVSLAYEYRDDVQGNKLVQIDTDGTITDLWSAWDCFDPETHISSDPDHGWIHANALDYDESTDSFLVGMRNLSTIVRVDRATGECVWSIGRGAGDVDTSGGVFLHQHQFHWTDGGFLVFDNMGAGGLDSRVLEYSFDEAAGTAKVVREIFGDPPAFSLILGDVHRMDNADTVIVWSSIARAERVKTDDSRTWTITGPDEATFGFVEPWHEPTDVGAGPHFP